MISWWRDFLASFRATPSVLSVIMNKHQEEAMTGAADELDRMRRRLDAIEREAKIDRRRYPRPVKDHE